MNLRLAAALSLCALIAAGVVNLHKKIELSSLENNVSKILQDAKIAATPSCVADFCEIENLISKNFSADLISISGVQELLGYVRYIDTKTRILSYIASAWAPEFRGSKLWWLLYEKSPKRDAKFSIKVQNLHPKINFAPLYFVLSDEACTALESLSAGFDLHLERDESTQIFIKNTKGQSLQYDFSNPLDEPLDTTGLLSLLKELLGLSHLAN